MLTLKNFAGKLISGLLAIENGIILVVGLAGAMVWHIKFFLKPFLPAIVAVSPKMPDWPHPLEDGQKENKTNIS